MSHDILITNAAAYVRQEYANSEMSLQDVAFHAGFSVDHFNRLFMAQTGFTVMSYVNYIRLKHALHLLRTTEKSILDIALDVGFASHEGFLRAFRKQYGQTPSEYRSQKKNTILSWGELVDQSVAARFLYDNPDLQAVDTEHVIDILLSKDAKRYGYFCGEIKYMGLTVAAPGGCIEKGLIAIGNRMDGSCSLQLVTEDVKLLTSWLSRFPDASFDSVLELTELASHLSPFGIKPEQSYPLSVYCGAPFPVTLPEKMIIRPLSFADRDTILQWAEGKSTPYVKHLLNENHMADASALDYGVFSENILLAVAGCGIDEIHGFRYNDCCHIHFKAGEESNSRYRMIYTYVVNDLIARGVLPYDHLQHGTFAGTHGGFTAEDLGFTVVSRRYAVRK